jgi:hypothetical protein
MAGSRGDCLAVFSVWRSGSCGNFIMQRSCAIWRLRPEIGWKRCAAATRVSTVFESMTSGAFASSGRMAVASGSRSLITAKGEENARSSLDPSR